ncbi:MAG: tetratricopeptide repeat protein [Candidatus Polarisedimenticolia bacterium]
MKTVRWSVLGLLAALLCAGAAWAGVENNERFKEGMAAYQAGNPSAAIEIWTEQGVASAGASDVQYFMFLSMAYANAEKPEQAIETARRGLALQPSDGVVIGNLHWAVGKAYLALKQFDQAAAETQLSISAAPQDPANYLLLARIQIIAGKFTEAEAAAARSLELKGTPEGCFLLGVVHLRQGKLAAAVQNFKFGLTLVPSSGDLWLGVAMGQLMQGDYAAAQATGRDAAAAGIPSAGEIQTIVAYYSGRYDDALAAAEQRLNAPAIGGVGASVVMGEVYPMFKGVVPGGPAAEADIHDGFDIMEIDGQKTTKGAFNIKPVMTIEEVAAKLRGPVGTTVKVKVWTRGGFLRLVKTKELTRKAMGETKSGALLALRSLALLAKGDAAKALADAREAATLDPNAILSTVALGGALLESNQPNQALEALENPNVTGTAIPFAEAQRQVLRALGYARRGDLDKAASVYFAAADQLDPKNAPVWSERNVFVALLKPLGQGHLDKAKQLDAQGRYAECLPEYAQALRYAADEQEVSSLRAAVFAAAGKMPTPPEMPDDAHRRVVRGELLIKEGDVERAYVEFMEAQRIAPYVPKLYYNTALICAQLKKYDRAIQQMNLYLAAAPEAPDARAAKDEIIKWELQQERQAQP